MYTLFPCTTLFRSLGTGRQADAMRGIVVKFAFEQAGKGRGRGMRVGEVPAERLCEGGEMSGDDPGAAVGDLRAIQRSEEHTSELQSLMRISYAVFCLKKKNTIHTHPESSPTQIHQRVQLLEQHTR